MKKASKKKKLGLKEWKKKYYPKEASECSKKNAIDFCINKWMGLRKSVLKRFGLKLDGSLMTEEDDSYPDGDCFFIDGDSCPLCWKYDGNCGRCPLFILNNYDSCDGIGGPYGVFVSRGDPGPMLKLLRKAKKKQNEKNTRVG